MFRRAATWSTTGRSRPRRSPEGRPSSPEHQVTALTKRPDRSLADAPSTTIASVPYCVNPSQRMSLLPTAASTTLKLVAIQTGTFRLTSATTALGTAWGTSWGIAWSAECAEPRSIGATPAATVPFEGNPAGLIPGGRFEKATLLVASGRAPKIGRSNTTSVAPSSLTPVSPGSRRNSGSVIVSPTMFRASNWAFPWPGGSGKVRAKVALTHCCHFPRPTPHTRTNTTLARNTLPAMHGGQTGGLTADDR